MFCLHEQDLLSELSTYTLRKAELELVHMVMSASKIKERKLKKKDKTYWAGVGDNYIELIYALRRCMKSRGCILYKKSVYMELLGERNA